MVSIIEGVVLSELKIIPSENGSVMHGLKVSDPSFHGFGEAYFSSVNKGAIKGWKRHTKMTLNIIVPVGCIRFVIYDGKEKSKTFGIFTDIKLGIDFQFSRLTVSPGLWMAFQGIGDGLNLLLNIGSIPHDPTEADQLPVNNDSIPHFNW